MLQKIILHIQYIVFHGQTIWCYLLDRYKMNIVLQLYMFMDLVQVITKTHILMHLIIHYQK